MSDEEKTVTEKMLREAEKRMSGLLARIHRDGGHYELKHGTQKAWEDADKLIAELYAKMDAEKLPNFMGSHQLFTPAVFIYEALDKLKHALRNMDETGPGSAVWCLRVVMEKSVKAMEELARAETGIRFAQGRKEGLRDGRAGCVCDKGEHCPAHDLPLHVRKS